MMDGQTLTNILMAVIAILTVLFSVFQWATMQMVKGVKDKVTAICEQNQDDHKAMCQQNEKVHDEIWARVYHHKHSECGNVEVT